MADMERTADEWAEYIADLTAAGKMTVKVMLDYKLAMTKTGKAVNTFGKATGEIAKGFKNSAKAVADSTGNFTDLTPVINATIGAITGLLNKIPLVGEMFSGLGEAAKDLATFSIQQIQSGFASYQKLAEAGQMGAEGITGLGKAVQRIGIPLATYSKLLTENSESLAYFSSSALDGGKSFTETLEAMKGAEGQKMRNLGMNITGIGEAVIDFQVMQRKLGMRQELSQKQIIDGTQNYAYELDTIAKLTGIGRKELQKQREANLSEARFRATMAEHTLKYGVESSNALNSMVSALAKHSPQLAQGLKDVATGFINTEAAQRVYRSGMGDTVKGIINSFNRDLSANGSAAKVQSEAFNTLKIKSSELAKVGGMNQALAKILGDDSPFINFAELSNVAGLAMKKFSDSVTAANKQMSGKGDKATSDLNKSMANLQQATASMNAMFLQDGVFTKGIDGFAKALNTVTGKIYEWTSGNDQDGNASLNTIKTKNADNRSDLENVRNNLAAAKNDGTDPAAVKRLTALEAKLAKRDEVSLAAEKHAAVRAATLALKEEKIAAEESAISRDTAGTFGKWFIDSAVRANKKVDFKRDLVDATKTTYRIKERAQQQLPSTEAGLMALKLKAERDNAENRKNNRNRNSEGGGFLSRSEEQTELLGEKGVARIVAELVKIRKKE